jgi:hypothetical protein
MYYNAFEAAFGSKGASSAGTSARKASTASNTATPGRSKKKGGFDPTGGADEGAARMAGYNTKPRSNSETRVPQSGQDRESSDDFTARRDSDIPAASASKKNTKKPARARQRASDAGVSASRASNAGKVPVFPKSGSEADSTGSPNLGPDLKPGSLPKERRKAMPSRRWKNNSASKSDETLSRSPEPASFNTSTFKPAEASPGAEQPGFKYYSPFFDSFDYYAQKNDPGGIKEKELLSSMPAGSSLRNPLDFTTQSPEPNPIRPSSGVSFRKPTIRPETVQEERLFEKIKACANKWTTKPGSDMAIGGLTAGFQGRSSEWAGWRLLGHVESHLNLSIGKDPLVHAQGNTSRFRELFESQRLPDDSSKVDPINPSIPSPEESTPHKVLLEQLQSLPKSAYDIFASVKSQHTNKRCHRVNLDPNMNDESPSRPAPPIDTSFSAEDWTSQPFTFVGSPTKEEPPKPTPFGPSLFGEIGTPPTSNAPEATNGPPPAPSVEEVAEEIHAPRKASVAAEEPKESPNTNKRTPVAFSEDHWKQTFKDPIFALPKFPMTIPTQAVPGVKNTPTARRPSMQRNRSPSKDVGTKAPPPEVLGDSQVRPIIIEEDDGKNDVDAMDIDTPPKTTFSPLRGPRMVRVPTTRLGDQPAAITPTRLADTALPKAGATPNVTPEGRRRSARRDPKPVADPVPEPPTSLNLGSLKSHLSNESSGVHSLEDMHLHLPFESRASTLHPGTFNHDEITTIIPRPKPPHAPILPISGTISQTHYRNLLAEMSNYMGSFHKYEHAVLAGFAKRHDEGARFGTGIPSTEATNLLNAKGEPRGQGVLAYAEALREETRVREEWMAATDMYMKTVAGWAFLKQMVVDRGFAKDIGVHP